MAREVTIVRICDLCRSADAMDTLANGPGAVHTVAVTDGHTTFRLDLCAEHYREYNSQFGTTSICNPRTRRGSALRRYNHPDKA